MADERRDSDRPKSKRKREPDYGVDKARLPKKWIRTREAIENQYALQVKTWYFPVLIIVALLLFTLSAVTGSLWLAVLGGALSIGLAYWNAKAGEEQGEE